MAKYPGLFLLILLVLTLQAPNSQAEMAAKHKTQAGVPVFSVVGQIMRANEKANPLTRKSSSALITWLAPSDPRLQAIQIIGQPENKVYGVRNLSGHLSKSIGSVDYGVRNLHTPVLLITACTNGHALALLKNPGQKIKNEIGKELGPLRDFLKDGAPQTPEQELRHLEKWIDMQVEQASSRYRDRIENRRLAVIGSIADFANHYRRGSGKLIVININGEQDVSKLRKLSIMRQVSEGGLAYIGRQGSAVYPARGKITVKP